MKVVKRSYLEKRAAAYREFKQWAIQEIASSVIRHGFKELSGTLEMVLQAYRTFEKEHPV
jgi:hypothetical protein